MDTDDREYEVANGRRITLPELNEEDKEFGMTAEIRTYIRQTIHHPNWIGWPTIEEFGKLGVLLHPLDDQTARALLVIDDEPAIRFLATLQFAYEHIGYTLYIDHATMVRPRYDRPEPVEEPPVSQPASMEVA
jgi:hypothetical protein